ncbi:pirin family protein [Fimbriiglobus ruber]|uniref:Pirin n=1 Tax=Fimbriiglobus ruber TaxID=1908690 RepID=A0A225DJ47_9BACT|nr:pirin family protein [Fimbriiglobus ruber]OWK39724.1 Pirin [Fimbriiglobus ruber]
MFTLRKANDRGTTNIGWLDSRHSFSFGDYFDSAHHHFRTLRVINDDKVAGGGGFPSHPHRDMEILTYVLSGALAHRDSMGNGSTIRPGEWQKMSAGTGIVHSEFNASKTEPVHLLQIWIVPEKKGLTPGYAEKTYPESERLGKWRVAASRDGRHDSIVIHQDVTLSVAKVRPGDQLQYPFARGRGGWLHVATGAVTVNGQRLDAGDAMAVEGEPVLDVTGNAEGEVLLFDLA